MSSEPEKRPPASAILQMLDEFAATCMTNHPPSASIEHDDEGDGEGGEETE